MRLAGTLALLEWAWKLGQAEPQTITAASMNAAVILWRDYFHPHSRAALRQIGLTDQQADARRVLRWIRLKGLTEVSREDIRRDALRQKLNAEQTEAVLNSLTRLNWLQKRTITQGSKVGRQAHRWLVNPCLANPTAEIAENAEMGAGSAKMAISAIPQLPQPPWRIGNEHLNTALNNNNSSPSTCGTHGVLPAAPTKGLQMTKRVAKPNKQPEPAKGIVKPYEPTPYERRTLDTIRARNAEKPLAPRIKVTNEKGVTEAERPL